MNWKKLLRSEGAWAGFWLAVVLNVAFFPALWGGKTLLTSAWDAASVMPSGAYDSALRPQGFGRTPDAGAPAWLSEPLFAVLHRQLVQEKNWPLWNPYAGFGTPLAAAMQPQPFYPLTFLLALHPTPYTYNLFILARLFVGGLLMFLFARLYLARAAALFAATAFMLTGYFVLFLNMPHMSVEVLLPGVLYAFERLLRAPSPRSVAGGAFVVFLTVVGGMPESTFLVLGFGSLYALFRLAVIPEYRRQALAHLVRLAAAGALGFAMGAVLLLPFLEYLPLAHDSHQPANLGGNRSGLTVDSDPRSMVLYLVPLLFGPVGQSIFAGGWTGMRSYWGLLPCLFGFLALFSAPVPKAVFPRGARALTYFFAAGLALMLLKRFGSPVINWIGFLPLAEMVLFPKYQEPLMALGVAFLAGTGFALFSEGRTPRWLFRASALVLAALVLGLAGWSLPRVMDLKAFHYVFWLSLVAGLLVILTAVVLAAASVRTVPPAWVSYGFLGFLALELVGNFILPCFYGPGFNLAPPVVANPYAGAPYIDFLKQGTREHQRVFAREGFLYPNWAGAFGLADVRSLDAMFYGRYMRFIRNFLLKPGDENRLYGDLADRFTGFDVGDFGYPYNFDTDLERRFLQLSSVKYLVSGREYGPASTVVDEILEQHKSENLWGFERGVFHVAGGKVVTGLFHRPPSRRLTYRTRIDPARPVLEFVAAIKKTAHSQSDGVGFLLELRRGQKIETLFSVGLNPRDVPAHRDGIPVRIDLSRYAGREVEFLFSTDPGPSGNNAWDWAGWTRLRFSPAEGVTVAGEGFPQAYNGEVGVYEVPNVLPRAALFYAVEVAPERTALARLKEPAFDIRQKAVVSEESLSPSARTALAPLVGAAPRPLASARIVLYESRRVQVEADADAPALLVLNDADYPGWRAWVDGRPAPILAADHLFRGVLVPTGRHVVEFVYQPASFLWGLAVSLLAFLFLAGLWCSQSAHKAKTFPKS